MLLMSSAGTFRAGIVKAAPSIASNIQIPFWKKSGIRPKVIGKSKVEG